MLSTMSGSSLEFRRFAVPIRPQGRDVIAALTINMTSARLTPKRLKDLLAALRREVQEIERQVNPMHSVAQSRRASRP